MPSFLVNDKMNPELRERVLASVRGRKREGGPPRRAGARHLKVVARVVVVLSVVVAVVGVVTLRRGMQRDFEQRHAGLLAKADALGADLSARDLAAPSRVEAWLLRLGRAYEGDVLGDTALLAKPMIYVRGPLASFGSPDQIAQAAADSYKDAFLLCLLDPPKTRREAELVTKVHLARAGGAVMEDRTPTVRRLHDLANGLSVLLPAWSDRVRGAEDSADLSPLEKELERAPVDRAKQAAHARVLLAVMDEPGDGVTELDGERPHDVRVALIDLDADSVVFRLRRRVDPKWISAGKRPTHASDLDACALAYDLHEELGQPR